MPKLAADLLTRLQVKVAGEAIAVTTIDRCGMASELLVTLTGVGRSKFMKTLQPQVMEHLAGGKHSLLQERSIALVLGQQIAATGR